MPDRKLGRQLLALIRQWQQLNIRDLAPLNLGSGQAAILLGILENPEVSQETLSSRIGIDKTTTAKALRKLEDCGYVVRERSRGDRRRNRMLPTEQARALRPILERLAREHVEILLRGFLGNEIERASGYLSRMQENLRRELVTEKSVSGPARKPTAWD